MLEQGEIPAVKIGAQWRFDQEKIRTWIESHASAPRPDALNPDTK
jgi:predicted DNA-binding transcriptional regulator AlpA